VDTEDMPTADGTTASDTEIMETVPTSTPTGE
jgi:hypothetical protein